MSDTPDIGQHEEMVRKYFSNPAKMIHLKRGNVLLHQYEENNRLFYVMKGKVCGYLPDKELHEPVLEANSRSFVGVYSFFSQDRKSYSELLAEEDSEISYYDGNPFDLPLEEARELLIFLFNKVVGELRTRQHFAGRMAHENQATLQKLIQSEKMATLGQMSAGLAHELNNAIGALSSNLRQVQEEISAYLKLNEDQVIFEAYQKGLEEGQNISSSEARESRTALEKLKFLDKATSKKLSRAGISPLDIKKLSGEDKYMAKKIAAFWEMGYLLHDMHIAGTHATHVIQSVKNLGVSHQQWIRDADINKSLDEALAILRNMTKQVELEVNLSPELPSTEACPGELVQVWINLVKNAVESLLNANIEYPKLIVNSESDKNNIRISITDNGQGIPKDLEQVIFQPNFTTKKGGLSFGLGLGLTIVKRIINEHNGEIKVDSRPGHTCFEVLIPIVND